MCSVAGLQDDSGLWERSTALNRCFDAASAIRAQGFTDVAVLQQGKRVKEQATRALSVKSVISKSVKKPSQSTELLAQIVLQVEDPTALRLTSRSVYAASSDPLTLVRWIRRQTPDHEHPAMWAFRRLAHEASQWEDVCESENAGKVAVESAVRSAGQTKTVFPSD